MAKDIKRQVQREVDEITTSDWKPRVLLIGGVVGAAVGLAAAYMLLQRYGEDRPPDITMGEGVKIGMMVAGLLRGIAAL